MEIASFGHSGSHTSQLMHSSVMIRAMLYSLRPAWVSASSPDIRGPRSPDEHADAALLPEKDQGAAGSCGSSATLSCKRFSTDGNTNLLTSPPSCAISRTIVPEMNWY